VHLRSAVLTAVTAAAVAIPVLPAAAADVAPEQPKLRIACHTNWKTSTSANVWCDGHGPARYGASIQCKKGSAVRQLNYGPGPWLGDRRGISMYCPGGGYKRVKQWGWPA